MIEEKEQPVLHVVIRCSVMVLQVLETVLELLLTEHGQLDTAYCSLQPLEQRRQNVLYMLGHHLNHPANADVMAPLLARAAKMGPPAVRLLRILCARLFWGDKYLQQKRIARGAYAEVGLPWMLAPPQCLPGFRTSRSLVLLIQEGKRRSISSTTLMWSNTMGEHHSGHLCAALPSIEARVTEGSKRGKICWML